MRARPRPGMLTQPGCSHPFPSTRMLLMQKRGESRTPVDAGPPAPGGHCGTHTAPPGRRTVGVCELTKLGEVGAGGGTRGPRRPARGSHPNWKEPVRPEEPLQPRAPRGTLPGAPTQRHSNPPGAGGNGRARELLEGRWPGDTARTRPGVPAERVQTPSNTPVLPTFCAAKRRGPAGPGAQSRAGGGDTGGAPRTPEALAGVAQRRTATPLPSVTRSPAQDGRVPSADRVHVGRRARSRPAPSSAALAAHGRRRRAPEAGGDRLQPV